MVSSNKEAVREIQKEMSEEYILVTFLYGQVNLKRSEVVRVHKRICVLGKTYTIPTNRWRYGLMEYWFDD